jgi:hypothetical protein
MIWPVVTFSMIFNSEGFGTCTHVLTEAAWARSELAEHWERATVAVVDRSMLSVFAPEQQAEPGRRRIVARRSPQVRRWRVPNLPVMLSLPRLSGARRRFCDANVDIEE